MNYNSVIKSALCTLAVATLLQACTDADYDLSKDIDMTMGLGSSGLALRVGSTEKIYLKDVLEESDELQDAGAAYENLYYLTKTGFGSVSTHVEPIEHAAISEPHLASNNMIDDITDFTPIPGIAIPPQAVEIHDAYDIWFTDLQNIPEELIYLRNFVAVPDDNPSVGYLPAQITFELIHSGIDGLTIESADASEGIFISFPEEMHFRLANGEQPNVLEHSGSNALQYGNAIWVSDINTLSTPVDLIIDSIVVNDQNPLGERVPAERRIRLEGEITMGGSVKIGGTAATSSPSLQMDMRIRFNDNNPMQASIITGVVNPEVTTEDTNLDIAEDLPDFLVGDEVVVDVANPTIKISVLGAPSIEHEGGMPAPIQLYGEASSVKNGAMQAAVNIGTENEPVYFEKEQNTTKYFSQTGTAFDPDPALNNSTATALDLNSLIRRLPDNIGLSVNGSADTTVLHTLRLGRGYGADIEYNLYIPFQFNNALNIVYRDTLDGIGGDLDDYQADSLYVTGVCVNAVPLEMELSLVPYGEMGIGGERPNLSSRITVTPVAIDAATGADPATDSKETNIRLGIRLNNPADLRLLDAFVLKVEARGVASSELSSAQYIQLNDLRLHLGGQITADFNDDND